MSDEPTDSTNTNDANGGGVQKPGVAQQLLPWIITLACFGYLYTKLSGAAVRIVRVLSLIHI